jgi:hypothetical protein
LAFDAEPITLVHQKTGEEEDFDMYDEADMTFITDSQLQVSQIEQPIRQRLLVDDDDIETDSE